MLPTYTNETFHHRHGQPNTSTGGMRLSGGQNFFLHVPRQKRALFKRVLQGIVALCVLIPVFLLVTSHRRAKLSQSIDDGGQYLPGGGTAVGEGDQRTQTGSGQSNSQAEAVVKGGARDGGAAGRKMMTQKDKVPLPGAKLKHLVLVAGHAVYVGRDYSEAHSESSWFLEEYQKVKGEASSFVEHIELGIREAAQDPDAMLLFSGGQTRLAAGPRSEGLSYWVVAEAAGWFNTTGVRERTFTEEHARDSFENLMFSMCRFYELSGHYPDRVTVVSYNLKRDRFKNVHRAAINFPDERFKFIGSELPPDVRGAQEGEARTVAAFKLDPYGCTGELLQKKLDRDPFAVGPPHPSRCPELKGLLQHCAPVLYQGQVPWL